MPEEDEDHQDDPANLRQRLRDLEKERNRLRTEATAGSEATKKLAIYEAGVTDPKTVKLLSKVHDGEWTAEALRETIAEYGFDKPGGDVQDEKPDERQEAAQQLAAVAAGNRGISDSRRAANDDEALQEELLEWMGNNIPAKGKLDNKQRSLDDLNKIMMKYGVKGPGLSS